MEIRVESVPQMRVAYISHRGPYDTCCQVWGRIYDWAGRNKFIRPGTVGIGASYGDPATSAPDRLRYDACLTCSTDFSPNGEVQVQTLGGGRFVTAIHRGPYRRIKDSFHYLIRNWLPFKGLKLRDAPCLEIYVDDRDRIPEEDVRTKLCVPIE